MQDLHDGGGIYFWGTMGEGANVIRNNLIHHVGRGKRTCVGIYLDDSCDDVIVRDNVVYGVNIGTHLHGSPRNLLENNVFVYCHKADVSIQPEAYNVAPMETRVVRNIFAWGEGTLFSTGESWNKNWPKKPIGEMDYNLYWRGGRKVALGQGVLKGFDRHSVVADPKFARPRNETDHVLQPGPAAAALGIKPIDLADVGPTKPPAWLKDIPKRKPLRFPLPPETLRTLPGRARAGASASTK
jgi:parallel beta-helix repeat protein